MPFIIAKTVTYVSSLTVTYVTTLYIVAARNVTKLSVPLNGIVSDIVRIRPTRFIFVDYTAREATSLPYTGWAIVVAWHAETSPGFTQESRIIHQPGAPLSAGTAR